MISEYLRTSLINQFKKRETDLLLLSIQFEPPMEKVHSTFYDDNYNLIKVVYNIEERRFTDLWYGITKIEL